MSILAVNGIPKAGVNVTLIPDPRGRQPCPRDCVLEILGLRRIFGPIHAVTFWSKDSPLSIWDDSNHIG